MGEHHLHFGVYEGRPAREGFDVPVNFRNTDGPVDERNGLVPGNFYKAVEYKQAYRRVMISRGTIATAKKTGIPGLP